MVRRILNVLELQVQLQDEQIETLVHRFYERIQHEPLLAPVFAARIEDRFIARRRREPVVYVAPLPRAVGIPTVTRRKHGHIWPTN